jgi:hypothetical protein
MTSQSASLVAEGDVPHNLDVTTRQRLIRLRILLAAAVASTADTTGPGRHVAVIFMDGVCELALSLAAQEVGVEVSPKQGMLDIYAKVAEHLGKEWRRQGAKAVRELHLQRNTLQHHGVLPDGENISVWATEIERFVFALVRAAFSADLATVRGADGVADDQLRQDLLEAETAIDTGRFMDSLEGSDRALGRMLSEFRTLRGRSPFGGFAHAGFHEFQVIDTELRTLQDFSDLAHLTTEPSERLWLDAVLEQARRTGEQSSRADAQRAYSFVLGCALRFEAFKARYPELRWVHPPQPSLDVDYKRPKLVEVVAGQGAVHGSSEMSLDFVLDQAPPGWDGHPGLHQALRELQGSGLRLGMLPRLSRHVLAVTVPVDTSADEILGWVEALLDKTHELFEERQRAARERANEVQSTTAPYSTLAQVDGLVRDVTSSEGGPGDILIALTLALPDDVREFDVETILNEQVTPQEGQLRRIMLSEGRVTFSPEQLATDRVIEVLERSIDRARVLEAKRQADAQADADRRAELLQGLRARIGQPPQ